MLLLIWEHDVLAQRERTYQCQILSLDPLRSWATEGQHWIMYRKGGHSEGGQGHFWVGVELMAAVHTIP